MRINIHGNSQQIITPSRKTPISFEYFHNVLDIPCTKRKQDPKVKKASHTHTHNMYMHAQKYPQTYTQNKHGTPRNVFLAGNSYEFRVFPHSVFDIPCRKKKKDPILEKCFPNTSSMPLFGHSLTDT